MTQQPHRPARARAGQLPTPLGWADHRTRTVALNAWLAREEAVAVGAAVVTDPALLGLPDRETLLRALFQRFATTLEGVLDVELELSGPTSTLHAVRRRPCGLPARPPRTVRSTGGRCSARPATRWSPS